MSLLRFDLRLPLDRFDLDVAAELPSRAAVLGPSGAGKSSLLEALAGIRRSAGRIVLGDLVLQDTPSVRLPPEKRGLGWVPQEALLLPHLDVRANLLFGTGRGWRHRRLDGWPGADELIELLELEALLDRYPRYLSGGERRRVALGRALMSRPRLLLLDEPTQGLDPRRARRVLGCLRSLEAEHGVPLLVVTHRRDEALALADVVLRLEHGRVVDCGPARRLLLEGRPPERHERRENLVEARMVGHDESGGVSRVVLLSGEAELSIPFTPEVAAGSTLWLAIDAEEMLLARGEPHGLSARNVIGGNVDEMITERDVWIRVGPWWVHLTPAAARELELAPGVEVWLVAKSNSWRVVAE